jgi:hypothetical protein
MFNEDFYPTPSNLITEMLVKAKNINFYHHKILEPSAGKGDILDGIIKKEYNHNDIKINIDCIEIEPELQSILIGKGYNVIANDFLTFNTYTHYDLIIMNPPFSDGATHLLKAIELQEKDGGQIICLLNAETIKNPYSNERKELAEKLNRYGATIDFKQNTFTQAERKSNVEVALISLVINNKEKENNIFDKIRFEAVQEEEFNQQNFADRMGLVSKDDTLKFMIEDYRTQVKLLKNAIVSSNAFKNFSKSIKKEIYADFTATYGNNENDFNSWLKIIRKKYWESALNIETLNKYVTQNVRYDFDKTLEKQANIEFNMENIYKVKQMLISAFLNNLEKSAIQVFEDVTRYNYNDYSNNIYLYNGWKTNKGSKINKKIILPLSFADSFYGTIDYNGAWSEKEKIKEIEKILNYFDGFKEYKSIFENNSYQGTGDYLDITAYKKGTTHIVFKRLDLLDQFNLFVGKKKNWIPDPSELKTDKDKEEYNNIKKEIFEYYDYTADFGGQLLLPEKL